MDPIEALKNSKPSHGFFKCCILGLFTMAMIGKTESAVIENSSKLGLWRQ